MHCLALVSAVDPLLVDLTALALHGEEALALTASLLGLAAPAVAAPSSPTPFPQGASHSAPAASWNCLIFWNNCRS